MRPKICPRRLLVEGMGQAGKADRRVLPKREWICACSIPKKKNCYRKEGGKG